jgi:multiple antibiotic resistance protein
MMPTLTFKEIATVTLVLFAVIDILGSIPVIITLRAQNRVVAPGKATLYAGALMVVFLFLGEQMLGLIGIDKQSFATAGAIVIFLIGLEMVLGINLFHASTDAQGSSFVPLVFPLIAGAGTLTTLISLRAAYSVWTILIAIFANLIIVFVVLRAVPWFARKLGAGGLEVLRRSFGVILLALAVKLFKDNWVSVAQ